MRPVYEVIRSFSMTESAVINTGSEVIEKKFEDDGRQDAARAYADQLNAILAEARSQSGVLSAKIEAGQVLIRVEQGGPWERYMPLDEAIAALPT